MDQPASSFATPPATAPLPRDMAALSAEHSEILTALASLDYAPPALRQQDVYVRDLTERLSALKKRLVQLEARTKKEKKEADELSGSHARKLAYKISGKSAKFEEKASKEQRYVLALALHDCVTLTTKSSGNTSKLLKSSCKQLPTASAWRTTSPWRPSMYVGSDSY